VGAVRVVDLADECGLTTAATMDVCDRAGIPVVDGSTVLTVGDVEAFRRALATPVAAVVPAPLGGWVNDPPEPPPGADEPRPHATARPPRGPGAPPGPSDIRHRPPLDRNAVWAMVLAPAPAVAFFFGFIGALFMVPTFVFAARYRRHGYTRHGRQRGGTLAFLAPFVTVICFATTLGLAFAYGKGAIVTSPSQAVANLFNRHNTAAAPTHVLPRDCVSASGAPTIGASLTGVHEVSCSEPHDAEVFEVYTRGELAARSGIAIAATGPRPDERTLDAAIARACADDVRSVTSVGAGVEESIIAIVPTEDEWNQGTGDLACAVGIVGQKVTGELLPG
jgi:hypothetical protein